MARTPKGRALGNALRQARQDQGLTVRAFATQLGRDPGVLSRWETGERTPKPEQVAQILAVLGINGDRYEEIIELAYGADDPSWVATTLPAQRQQLAAFLDFEHNATSITEVSPLLVPGLLQTSDYVRAMMRASRVPAGEAATRTAVRIGRKDVITRPEPVRLTALVGEAALLQVIGNRQIMVEQLRSLLDSARRPNVDVRVIRFDSGWHPALEGAFIVFEFGGSPPVVHLENRRSGLFLHEDADVHAYQRAAELVFELALSPDDSARLISDVARRMETRDGNA